MNICDWIELYLNKFFSKWLKYDSAKQVSIPMWIFLVEGKEPSFMVCLILCYLFPKAAMNFREALM